MSELLGRTIVAIRAPDAVAAAGAADRLDRMTKPRGSLGLLEDVAVRLAGIAGTCPPPLPEPAVVAVFAADHGVHTQGVTPWPQEVTSQMVANFLAGGAVVNAFAAQLGTEVCVVDVGVVGELDPVPGLLPRKVRSGTADMTAGPAMTAAEVRRAVEVGIETAMDLVAAGNRCLVTGDMGIANTTASAALVCAFTGADAAAATGRGSGVDEEMHAHKIDVVRLALARHRPDPADPLRVLAAIGGLEHAALAGFVLGGAAAGVPVLLDGVIAGSAAVTELWSFRFKAYQVFPMFPNPLSLAEALRHSVVMAPIQLRETLGYLSWDTIQPPAVAVACWGISSCHKSATVRSFETTRHRSVSKISRRCFGLRPPRSSGSR